MSANRLRGVCAPARCVALACVLLLGVDAAHALWVPWIGDVRVAPRDNTTATIHFNISFAAGRNEKSHTAAWVFFKVQAEGSKEWQTVRLAADRVVNPTGYCYAEGGPLEFVVPDGMPAAAASAQKGAAQAGDGFTGVFLRPPRDSKEAKGANNVTVVWDFTANKGITKDVKVRMRAFSTMMAYVAEGPFCLGSGGTEWNRFYEYTDGTQHTKPYWVKGPGAIPTGRQAGRLWARKGAQPEDGGEIPAAFPNGYSAFYCMVFHVSYAQYLGFLNTLPAEVADKYHVPQIKPYYVWYNHEGVEPMRIVRTDDPSKDRYKVERLMASHWIDPGGYDRDLHGMSWADGAAYAAWAGLRPMSELEFEKTCRGLRDPVPEECGPSYWGIVSFPTDQWPAHRRHTDRAVTVANPEGRRFMGTHGLGTWVLPGDWPQDDAVGAGFRGGGMSEAGSRLSDRLYAAYTDPRRRPYCSFRCVRTAPKEEEGPAPVRASEAGDGSTLKIEPLPDIADADIAIFHLAGRFDSAGDKPRKVVLASSLPEACFSKGAAPLALTAEPKVATPFRFLTVVTRQVAAAARYGQGIPFRVLTAGGDVLAEQTVNLPLGSERTPVIGSLEGGAVTLLVTNATDVPHALAVTLQPPPGIAIPEAEQRVEVAAGALARVPFAVPRQVFRKSEVCRIPYRVVVGAVPPQAGETAADLRMQSRWWVCRRIADNPKLNAGGAPSLPGEDGLGDLLADTFAGDDNNSVFQAKSRPKDWQPAVYGAGVPFGAQGHLPSRGSVALAATRVIAPAEREAVVNAQQNIHYTLKRLASGKDTSFTVRVWFNGKVAYDSDAKGQKQAQRVRIRKGVNTLLVDCRSNNDPPANPGEVVVTFLDAPAPDGKGLENLVFDMERLE